MHKKESLSLRPCSAMDSALDFQFKSRGEWHRRFREGRGSVEDDKRSGHPENSCTTENIEKVSAAIYRLGRMWRELEDYNPLSLVCPPFHCRLQDEMGSAENGYRGA
ncbi:hypothetical protein TNCV_2902951 [Trichonephila clavipes]|nr:hypothetical protein TNCV_2902951 [Trichonephila clavipes]